MKLARKPSLEITIVAALALALAFIARPGGVLAAERPVSGGELVFAVGGTPPSFDGHRETTFAMLHPVAPHYSTLLRFDPQGYPKIVGDVAESWAVSNDGLTYTFKIRRGILFHDGSQLTSKDVKATYEKIIFPPEGVASARQASYKVVEKIETPDILTVVFRLKQPSASFLAGLASPWNFIYKAEILEKDPRWYEKNIMGSGQLQGGIRARYGRAGGRDPQRSSAHRVSRVQPRRSGRRREIVGRQCRGSRKPLDLQLDGHHQ
jgi:peptide/nickel transport system substrate-binding protein